MRLFKIRHIWNNYFFTKINFNWALASLSSLTRLLWWVAASCAGKLQNPKEVKQTVLAGKLVKPRCSKHLWDTAEDCESAHRAPAVSSLSVLSPHFLSSVWVLFIGDKRIRVRAGVTRPVCLRLHCYSWVPMWPNQGCLLEHSESFPLMHSAYFGGLEFKLRTLLQSHYSHSVSLLLLSICRLWPNTSTPL